MPWRAPYLRFRRHPLAVAVYALVTILGGLLVANVFHTATTHSLDDVVPPPLAVSWQVEMLVGGGAGLASSFLPRKFLSGSLFLEGGGAFLCACGLGTYGAASVFISGWRYPGWLLFWTLGVGLMVRAVQTWVDHRRLERMAVAYQEQGEPS